MLLDGCRSYPHLKRPIFRVSSAFAIQSFVAEMAKAIVL